MPILNAGATPKQPTLTYRCFLIHTDEWIEGNAKKFERAPTNKYTRN